MFRKLPCKKAWSSRKSVACSVWIKSICFVSGRFELAPSHFHHGFHSDLKIMASKQSRILATGNFAALIRRSLSIRYDSYRCRRYRALPLPSLGHGRANSLDQALRRRRIYLSFRWTKGRYRLTLTSRNSHPAGHEKSSRFSRLKLECRNGVLSKTTRPVRLWRTSEREIYSVLSANGASI